MVCSVGMGMPHSRLGAPRPTTAGLTPFHTSFSNKLFLEGIGKVRGEREGSELTEKQASHPVDHDERPISGEVS